MRMQRSNNRLNLAAARTAADLSGRSLSEWKSTGDQSFSEVDQLELVTPNARYLLRLGRFNEHHPAQLSVSFAGSGGEQLDLGRHPWLHRTAAELTAGFRERRQALRRCALEAAQNPLELLKQADSVWESRSSGSLAINFKLAALEAGAAGAAEARGVLLREEGSGLRRNCSFYSVRIFIKSDQFSLHPVAVTSAALAEPFAAALRQLKVRGRPDSQATSAK